MARPTPIICMIVTCEKTNPPTTTTNSSATLLMIRPDCCPPKAIDSSRSPVRSHCSLIWDSLLTAGDRTSPNQVQYADEHVRRPRLIRALVEIGGLSVSAAKGVLDHLDAVDTATLDTLAKVQ